ncbi:retrovirus-related pol polyprotein from transposon TNT 1-94, partial [Tanacetum coccineum]
RTSKEQRNKRKEIGAKVFQVCESEEDDDSKKDEICLMAHDTNEVHLKVKLEPDEWIKDSGCSRHMMGNKDLFSTYEAINGGNVVFGSNTKSKIIDKGQICDKKCKVLFSETGSEILKDGNTIGRGIRKSGLYVMKIDHGREFDNEVQFGAFCDDNGITHNFSAPRTPQSNGVVERTDVAKITKHGHENGKSAKEPEVSSKRSIKSTLGQHWSITRRQNPQKYQISPQS